MKKLLLLPLAALLCLGVSAQHRHSRTPQSVYMQILPARAQKFVTDHFPAHTVSYVVGEKDFGSPMEFEVIFADKSFVTFDRSGHWREVQCGMAPVPHALVPEQIRSYIHSNFPVGTMITEIERTRRGYNVELSNDVELCFDRNGKFRRVKY